MNRRQKVCMCVGIVALILGICFAVSYSQVYAATEAVKTDVEAFDKLKGEQAYIRHTYFDNYHLDMEETDLFEADHSIMNAISNMLFTLIKWLGSLTVTAFYFCMDFDVAKLFSDEINTIQTALRDSIFFPLFELGVAATALVLLKKYIKRDAAGALGEIGKVVFLVVLSMLLVRESDTVLSKTTELTKSIAAEAIGGLNGSEQDMASYAATCSGVLWVNLIHQPWITIEFGSDDVSSETISFLMNPVNAPGTDSREKFIKNYDGTAFDMERGSEKVGFMFLYIFPFIFKCVIYLGIALLQLVFQLLAIFFVFLAPVVLILSMFPGYEGLLGLWVRKILESQISILLISFLMGLLIKFDDLLYDLTDDWGWLIVMVVQVVVAIGAVMKRDVILKAFSKMNKTATNSRQTMAAMNRGIDVIQPTAKAAAFVGRTVAGDVSYGYQHAKSGAARVAHGARVAAGTFSVAASEVRETKRQTTVMKWAAGTKMSDAVTETIGPQDPSKVISYEQIQERAAAKRPSFNPPPPDGDGSSVAMPQPLIRPQSSSVPVQNRVISSSEGITGGDVPAIQVQNASQNAQEPQKAPQRIVLRETTENAPKAQKEPIKRPDAKQLANDKRESTNATVNETKEKNNGADKKIRRPRMIVGE